MCSVDVVHLVWYIITTLPKTIMIITAKLLTIVIRIMIAKMKTVKITKITTLSFKIIIMWMYIYIYVYIIQVYEYVRVYIYYILYIYYNI